MKLALLFLTSLNAAPPAGSPLLLKFNGCAEAMNTVAQELERDVANRKHMAAAAVACDRLFDDEGWFRKR